LGLSRRHLCLAVAAEHRHVALGFANGQIKVLRNGRLARRAHLVGAPDAERVGIEIHPCFIRVHPWLNLLPESVTHLMRRRMSGKVIGVGVGMH